MNDANPITPLMEDTESSTVEEVENTQSSGGEGDNTADVESQESEQSETEEENVPLHKDERFREVINERNQLREEMKQLQETQKQKFEEMMKQFQEMGNKDEEDIEVPEWFGGDDDDERKSAFKNFKGYIDNVKDEAKKEAIQELKQQEESQQKAVKEATDYMNNEVSRLEKEHDTTIDKNKLLKTVEDYNLVDTKGNWNYQAAYQILKSQEDAKNAKTSTKKDERKDFASLGEEKATPTKPKLASADSFKFNNPLM